MASNDYLRFQRGNFIVKNIEQSLQLYRDVLGFEVAFVKDSPEDSYSYPVFQIDEQHQMRFAVLSTASQVRVMALTEVPADLPPVPHPRRAAIVLEVGDVDAVVDGARAAGCHVYEEEELHTHDGRVGREVGIVDYDDNLVVIYKIPASE
ncbi:MAG: VOC family protein [Woeseiaceae bacterium]|nr:VOC family protein [Woeseiaceae bacterium]